MLLSQTNGFRDNQKEAKRTENIEELTNKYSWRSTYQFSFHFAKSSFKDNTTFSKLF